MTRKILSIGVLVCLVLSLSGCGKQAQKKNKLGVKDTPLSPVEEKKAKLLRKIDRKFENPDAHFALGQLYNDDGLWDKAEYEYNVTLSFDPAYRQAQAAMVKNLLQSDQQAKARMAADMYINQVSASARESLRLGRAFQDEQMDDYAIACYMQALNLIPNSAAIYKQIGYYYLSRHETVRAEEYLKRSFQLDPYQAEVAGELGRMGVVVRVPRKTQKNTKKFDDILNREPKDK